MLLRAALILTVVTVASCKFVKFDRFDEELWKDQESVLRMVERIKEGDASRSQVVKDAEECDPARCPRPNCRCSGWDVPGNLTASQTPQMIVLTFQNAVSPQNFIPYQRVFNRKNPNGCPATGSFFVSHEYTDYFQVQSLWAAGHEIGDNTVTSENPSSWDRKKWSDEVGVQKEMLKKYANIPDADIKGFRAPMLQPGGDAMVDVIQGLGFTYDSSRTTVTYRKSPKMMWPYTYDFASVQDCPVPQCPKDSHRGFWEALIPAIDGPDGHAWATLGSIVFANESQVVNTLLEKFKDAYNGNRAPITMVVDTMFLIKSVNMDGFLKFLDAVQTLYKDVYFVSAGQAIEWIKNPTPVARLPSFRPWGCSTARSVCDEKAALTCWYDQDRKLVKPPQGGALKMRWCSDKCTPCYPALNDPNGEKC